MTATPTETTAPAELRLGRDVVRRMRLPGPPVGRPLPSRIGSLASSVSRFAAATSRPVDVRRALAGPGPGGLDGSSAPPRWWTPVQHADSSAAPAADGATPASTPAWLAPARPVALRRLPERGLPRAAREVPNETSWTPGGIVGGLRSEVARIRRLDEVTAVGPMLTQNDRAKLNAGLAARNAQQAASAQAASAQAASAQASAQASVARRATTRTPRQPAAPAAAPSASEPPTAAAAPPVAAPSAPASAPGRGGSGSVSQPDSVPGSPPARSGSARTSGGRATVSSTSATDSVAGSPLPGAGTTPPSAGTTPPGAGSTPPRGGRATVFSTSATDSVAGSPPPGSGSPDAGPPATGSGGLGTVPAADSGPNPPPSVLRRVARPSWQLRSQQARFEGLVRRTPIGHGRATTTGSAPATTDTAPPTAAAAPVGLASVVSRLAAPPRTRPPGAGSTLESGVRSAEVVPAAGPVLIAGGADAPATIRRHAWAAGSLVMRQAADAGGRAATIGTARASVATSAVPAPADSSAPAAATPAAATPTAPSTPAPSAPAARSSEPVVRRLPSAVGVTPDAASVVTAGNSAVPAPSPGVAPSAAPSATPDVRRLPRLWRRATEVRPATDVRTSVPAPVVRLAADPATPSVRRLLSTGTPTVTESAGTPSAPAASTPATSTTPATTPTTSLTPAAAAAAATAVAPATAVRRSTFPVSRVGSHVATPGIAGAEVGMPELMTIRRATAHGTDASRTLATGFGAPQTIRPAGSAVAAPVGAVEGESRIWRRTVTPAGAASTARNPDSAPAPIPAGAGTQPDPGRPSTPVRRTWQPWSDTPAATTPGQAPGRAPGQPPAAFPAGPGAASAPTGRRPAADVRRMTVAPPRISLAPTQPAPPPVPEVARTGNLPVPGQPPVRRNAASGTGGSLVDSTAHLFATPDAPLVRRYSDPGGSSMSASSSSPTPGHLQIRRALSTEHGTPPQDHADGSFDVNALSDSLVDKVVERIERRVIDELERRGRRHGRGGF